MYLNILTKQQFNYPLGNIKSFCRTISIFFYILGHLDNIKHLIKFHGKSICKRKINNHNFISLTLTLDNMMSYWRKYCIVKFSNLQLYTQ
jgi:hypothetical protein